jgi:predicted RNase H-like HicB family nuclease
MRRTSPVALLRAPQLVEVEAEIREAIFFHVEGLREDNLPVPAASSQVEYIEVAA